MVQQDTYKHKLNKLKLLQKKDVYTDLLKGSTRDIHSQHGHKLNIEINFLVQQSIIYTFLCNIVQLRWYHTLKVKFDLLV